MKQLISLSLLALLFACTTPAEEDEPSNNAAPAEDAGGETPDASVSDVEPDAEINYEMCFSITDPEECVDTFYPDLGQICNAYKLYPVRIEDGYCILDPEPSETICSGGEILTDDPRWIWVRFNEDSTYTVGLVRENTGHPDWRYCFEGLDVPECACEGLFQFTDMTRVPLP